MLFPRLQYSEVEGKVQMLNDCAARLDISVTSFQDIEEDHILFTCFIDRCFVMKNYWRLGKQFIPISSTIPPYLTFLGTKTFGYVSAIDPHCSNKNIDHSFMSL